MKVHVSFQVLRWLIPIARWALSNIEKKQFHSVHETEQLEALKRFIATLEK